MINPFLPLFSSCPLRAVWSVILVVLCFITTALSLTGCRGDAKPEGLYTIKSVSADNEVVVEVMKAVNSGMLFDVKFHYIDFAYFPKKSKEQVEQDTQDHLDAYAKGFPENPKFEFVDGAEINLTNPNGKPGPSSFKMKNEDLVGPSTFSIPPGPARQIYLVFSTLDKYEAKMGIHLLLYRRDSQWRCADFSMNAISIAGITAERAFDLGQKELQAGDNFMAVAMLSLSNVLARGPNYRMTGAFQRLAEISDEVSKKTGYPVQPLDTFALTSSEIPLASLSVIRAEGIVYLQLHFRIGEAFQDDDQHRQLQMVIAAACLHKHPQIKKHFSGLAVATTSLHTSENKRIVTSQYSFEELKRENVEKVLRANKKID